MMTSVKRGDELQLTIIDAVYEGKAIARYEGLVVFVENAVPGDVVIAKIAKVKKNYAEAKIDRILVPSKLRVSPRCKFFGICGGCKWQNLDYNAQLQFKEQQVVDSFERIGGFKNLNILPIIKSDEVFFYRSKMEYSFSDQQWSICPKGLEPNNSDSVYLGLHIPQRYDKILDIDECYLQSEISNKILNFTRKFARQNHLNVYNSHKDDGYLRFLVIRESKKTGQIMVNLVSRADDEETMKRFTSELLKECFEVTTVVNTINVKKAQIAFGQTEKVYYGDGTITELIGNKKFVVSASSFFQTNVAQAEKLYQVVKEFAEFKTSDVVYDLYSGTGSIAIFISDSVKMVIGIEEVESAIKDAERNSKINGVTNCFFVQGDLKDCLTKSTGWMQNYPRPSVLIIDPPRSGMHPKVVQEISKMSVEKIVYVSCNPATQARDIKSLCESKYQLVKLQPVDMFPHTFHIENVALLILR